LLRNSDDDYSDNQYLDTQDKDTDDFRGQMLDLKNSFPQSGEESGKRKTYWKEIIIVVCIVIFIVGIVMIILYA